MKIVVAIFEKFKILNFFLYMLGALDIECERDWPGGLGATLGDGQII